ncbi:MAG: xylulokinase [Acidobacteria bacterium]|nr:MAG: xylulokinase [Acidobacteriota bacterium]
MRHWLGLDIGTTGSRAVIIDESGAVRAAASAEHAPMSQPQPTWAEQDPEDWWRAAQEAIRAAITQGNLKGEDIAGVGLSGQMHGAVLLDEAHQVIRPAIIWCDQRSQAQSDWFTNRMGAARLKEITCNPSLTGFTVPKLLWVRDREPDNYRRMRTLLLPKDYVRFRLTGEFATEVSDASGTLLLDVPRREWSSEILQALELDRSVLPLVGESEEPTTRIQTLAATATGLRAGTPVVGGGGDQAAAGVGNGIVESGILSSTIGSSGVLFAHTDEPHMDPGGRVHTFCHAVRNRWHVMAVTQGAGLSLRWFRDNFGAPEIEEARRAGKDPYELLVAEAERVPPGSEGLLYLPYLMGERTPHLDPNARGVFFGLTARHTRAHVIRAILEGVAFSLRDGLEIFKAMGVASQQIRASGGGGRSPLWRQIQADVFQREMVTINVTEGSAYGAALLAASGWFGSVEEACQVCIRVTEQSNPDPARSRLYQEFYGIYRDLYLRLRETFQLVAQIGLTADKAG